MNSRVVTSTVGRDFPLGNGHCSLPRLSRLPTPGGDPTATATFHCSRAASGISPPSLRATSATCSHSSRLAVMMRVSGADCAHLSSLLSCVLGVRRTVRGRSMALTPSRPCHRTPTMGSTRSTTPGVPAFTVSPDPYTSSSAASIFWPLVNCVALMENLNFGSLRNQGHQPRPSANSMNWVLRGEPVVLLPMNSSPTFTLLPVFVATASGRTSNFTYFWPTTGSKR
mmetsp:Transcript_96317/g.173767  ORF Transcript_96317/g.173767 Transcript_96317/m.173767 type:complete len:226 (+) Transcript_96317:1382-2059(+)